MRGHQYSAATGAYTLETIVPKDYPGRTPHIHVKVQAANGPILTTQLFFPDALKAYGMNVPALNRYSATFDFVIET